MDMWLLGRKKALHIYGLEYTTRRAESMLELFDWNSWTAFYPVFFHNLPAVERTFILEASDLCIYSFPSCHMIPSIGIRAEFMPRGKTVVYSSDMEPCQAIVRLGMDADILIHEATGKEKGHSSAEGAAGVAVQAKVKELYLVHYSPEISIHEVMIEKASKIFPRKTKLATDFMVIEAY
jgi:ribonuclease BN (tRNA processing enzyme)